VDFKGGLRPEKALLDDGPISMGMKQPESDERVERKIMSQGIVSSNLRIQNHACKDFRPSPRHRFNIFRCRFQPDTLGICSHVLKRQLTRAINKVGEWRSYFKTFILLFKGQNRRRLCCQGRCQKADQDKSQARNQQLTKAHMSPVCLRGELCRSLLIILKAGGRG
jgi:hypothetical protein